ncbi:MAG: NAD(P)H-dependent oxidoreductase [Candidatus Pacebacteria bacterium]|nr:NAD(P)H-dependent oxidoreductase [Candidatus Paceibacterota bacterium]
MNNKEKGQEIINALNWRYATQVFDPSKKVSEEDLHTILESARLSPSVFGIEAWKFFVIKNPELRAKVGKQPKMTEASHLILITYRTDVKENITRERLERTAKIQNQKIEELDGLKKGIEGTITAKEAGGDTESWIRAQAYIPLGMMIETASLLGIDNGPMEGFDPSAVDDLLGLKEKNLKSLTMLALGYRGTDPASKRPKVRREFDEVVEVL